jgi:hypothetical protein
MKSGGECLNLFTIQAIFNDAASSTDGTEHQMA